VFFTVEDKRLSTVWSISLGALSNQQDGVASTVVLQLAGVLAQQFSQEGRAA
jgi:hypothetical protein